MGFALRFINISFRIASIIAHEDKKTSIEEGQLNMWDILFLEVHHPLERSSAMKGGDHLLDVIDAHLVRLLGAIGETLGASMSKHVDER